MGHRPISHLKVINMTRIVRKPRVLTLIVLVVAGLLGVGHIAATLAFTGPSNPIKSSLQPELNRYFLGPLDQGWNLFAPGPYSQDEYLLVRGCMSSSEVCAGGAESGAEFTEWRNVTAEEMESIPGNIFANRGARQSKAIVGRLWGAMSDLDDSQRQQVADPAVLGEPPFGVDVHSSDAEESFSETELSNLRLYQRLEDAAVGFASLYSHAEWGEASMVEIQLVRESVPPFEDRHSAPDQKSENRMYIGWRDAETFDEDTMGVWK